MLSLDMLIPLAVFVTITLGTWVALGTMSDRPRHAEDRLRRLMEGGPDREASESGVARRQAAFQANLAFARCIRAHGVPNFPEPTNSSESFHIRSSESFHISGHPNGKVNGPMAQAVNACKHLLPPGSVTTG